MAWLTLGTLAAVPADQAGSLNIGHMSKEFPERSPDVTGARRNTCVQGHEDV
jgi:hypothetical protein